MTALCYIWLRIKFFFVGAIIYKCNQVLVYSFVCFVCVCFVGAVIQVVQWTMS